MVLFVVYPFHITLSSVASIREINLSVAHFFACSLVTVIFLLLILLYYGRGGVAVLAMVGIGTGPASGP